jgi:hypothetical protein
VTQTATPAAPGARAAPAEHSAPSAVSGRSPTIGHYTLSFLSEDTVSRNKRYYPAQTVREMVKAAQEDLERGVPLTHFVNHESSFSDDASQMAGRISKVWMEGAQAKARIDLFDTQRGRDLAAVLKGGGLKTVSLRAGDFRSSPTERDGQRLERIDYARLSGIDATLQPGVEGARVETVALESAPASPQSVPDQPDAWRLPPLLESVEAHDVSGDIVSGALSAEQFDALSPTLKLARYYELWARGVRTGQDALEAVWSAKAVNDMPDSCFAYVEDGEKDGEGKTTPRSKRHLPYRGPDGKPDPAHVRNALARLDQADIPASAKASARKKLVAAAKQLGIEVSGESAREPSMRERLRAALERVLFEQDVDAECPCCGKDQDDCTCPQTCTGCTCGGRPGGGTPGKMTGEAGPAEAHRLVERALAEDSARTALLAQAPLGDLLCEAGRRLSTATTDELHAVRGQMASANDDIAQAHERLGGTIGPSDGGKPANAGESEEDQDLATEDVVAAIVALAEQTTAKQSLLLTLAERIGGYSSLSP